MDLQHLNINRVTLDNLVVAFCNNEMGYTLFHTYCYIYNVCFWNKENCWLLFDLVNLTGDAYQLTFSLTVIIIKGAIEYCIYKLLTQVNECTCKQKCPAIAHK